MPRKVPNDAKTFYLVMPADLHAVLAQVAAENTRNLPKTVNAVIVGALLERFGNRLSSEARARVQAYRRRSE